MRASIDRRVTIAACLALAATCLAAGLAASATAGPPGKATVFIETRLGLANSFPAFHGYARSDRHACEIDRRVRVFRRDYGADTLIGRDRTNDDGRYFVNGEPLSSGVYYARVLRREEGTAGTIFVCGADRSPIRVID